MFSQSVNPSEADLVCLRFGEPALRLKLIEQYRSHHDKELPNEHDSNQQ